MILGTLRSEQILARRIIQTICTGDEMSKSIAASYE